MDTVIFFGGVLDIVISEAGQSRTDFFYFQKDSVSPFGSVDRLYLKTASSSTILSLKLCKH